MLIHYFLTSLKPVELFSAPPMRTEEFLQHARENLSGTVLDDLMLLAAQKNQVEKRSFWRALATHAQSTFLRAFATDAIGLFNAIAYVLMQRQQKVPQTIRQELCFLSDTTSQLMQIELHSPDDADLLAVRHHLFVEKLAASLNHHDPLATEKLIANELVELMYRHASDDAFADEQVFIYFIKLHLCERFYSLDHTTGLAVLNKILQTYP